MSWALLLVRVAVGGIFLAAGGLKMLDIAHPEIFAAQIAGFRIVPEPLVAPLAILLPFVEVVVGAYLIAGFYARPAAWAACALAFVFDAAIASAVMRGMTINCGCFGGGDASVTTWGEVARDAVLVLAAFVVALAGPGRLALDERLARKQAT